MAIFLMHEVRWQPGSAARSYRNLPKHCESVAFPPALTNRPSSSERTTHREKPKYRDSLALPPDLPRGQSDPERAILRENPKHGDSLALHPDLPRGRSDPERAILRENPKRSVVFERTPWHVLRAPIVPGRIYWILPKRSRMSRRTFRENPKYWHRNQPSLRKAPMRTAILPPHRSSSEPSFRKFPIRLAIPERASEFIGPFFTGKARMLRVFPMRPVRVEAAAHHDEEDGAASARTFRIMPIRQSLARR